MSQNIYDDPGFFEGYSQLARSLKGLAGAPEWPSLRALLPNVQGLQIADLGCGFGGFCRWAREHGAAHVLGLDVSGKMLARAKAETSEGAITYQQADLEHLALPEGAFELAFSSLALHYVEDLSRLLATVHRGLVPGGRFVFSTEHPIFMASRQPAWMRGPEGHRTWPVDSYQLEGKRTTRWLADGVVKYHRTLGTTLNTLIRQGFTLRHVEEWGPSSAQLAAHPELAEEQDRPMFLLVSAQR
ncbi:class I SAM-dependent methyltransferase [Stigmatella erecta]|uniref:Methyltransferase domain-containing protein n=1 Tax=Stigmatella erecta TaxID=83460 RepID=A0A1I0LGK0_9BACT|nr:methyltransferase domain-containing protein [Stigmatella erecta]SEU39249.1 Methyltransferase domain-containing protein [Stigmatella erecta]